MNARTPMIRSILLMAAIGFSMAALGAESIETCNSCADCEAKLTSGAYDTVVLDNDILEHEGTCINLNQGESDLTFDCAGHLIDGTEQITPPARGIAMLHGSGNTIINCILSQFDSAIYLVDSSDMVISNNRLLGNRIGIDLSNSHSNHISDNGIRESSTGIKFSTSDNNLVESNAACDNFPWDIYLASGIDNVGLDNTCGVTYYWNDSGTVDCTFTCDVFGCGFEDGTLGTWTWSVGN